MKSKKIGLIIIMGMLFALGIFCLFVAARATYNHDYWFACLEIVLSLYTLHEFKNVRTRYKIMVRDNA